MSKEDFGKWLRLLRVRNGMSQADLSRVLEVDQTTVSRLELGKQNLTAPLAAAIAGNFGFAVDEVWAVFEPELLGGVERDDQGNVTITPPPATARISTAPASVSTSTTSTTAMEIARRIDALPGDERRRITAYVRAMLTAAENEAELRRDMAAAGMTTPATDDYRAGVKRLIEKINAEVERMINQGTPAPEAERQVWEKLSAMSSDELMKYLQ